ncbi:hypothetical protein PMAYCL1PPCAC_30367, partial [Pristionchus mayeri]
MIFLPGLELEFNDDDTVITFLLDNSLYFLYEDGDGEWAMRVMNTNTLNVAKIEVRLEEFESSLLDLYGTVSIHNEKAYMWNYIDKYLCEGVKEKDAFHWKTVGTTGDS